MKSAPHVHSEHGTVLVVDDERYNRDVLKRLLRIRGYEVHCVEDGETALEVIPSLQPELILLDVRMPGMDGYDVCRKLKEDPVRRDIPIIFISGFDDVAAKLQAFGCGGVDYVTKPFVDAEILARVGTHLSLRRLWRRLEGQIGERTAALAAANELLQREIANRRQANERFRGVLESAPDAIVLIDSQGRIVLANSRTETLFGYSREELFGQPLQILMPQRFRSMHTDGGAGCPKLDSEAFFGLHKDGGEFPVEISLNPLQPAEQGYVVGAIRDVSGRLMAEAALRELAAHSDAVREEERKRIAGEIHDELGALLTGIKMEMSLLRTDLGGNEGAGRRLAQVRETVREALARVRQVATQLRPSALNLGLVPALEWLVEDFGRRSGLAAHLLADGETPMGDAQATAVFRIVQESLTNVGRHAMAARVDVILKHTGKGLDLTVADDGCGFDTGAVQGASFGLMGMRERALALGGRVAVASSPGKGTRVSIWIPMECDRE